MTTPSPYYPIASARVQTVRRMIFAQHLSDNSQYQPHTYTEAEWREAELSLSRVLLDLEYYERRYKRESQPRQDVTYCAKCRRQISVQTLLATDGRPYCGACEHLVNYGPSGHLAPEDVIGQKHR